LTLTGLAPVLIVPDVGEALAFYRDKLGFEVDDWEPKPAAYGYTRNGMTATSTSARASSRPGRC